MSERDALPVLALGVPQAPTLPKSPPLPSLWHLPPRPAPHLTTGVLSGRCFSPELDFLLRRSSPRPGSWRSQRPLPLRGSQNASRPQEVAGNAGVGLCPEARAPHQRRRGAPTASRGKEPGGGAMTSSAFRVPTVASGDLGPGVGLQPPGRPAFCRAAREASVGRPRRADAGESSGVGTRRGRPAGRAPSLCAAGPLSLGSVVSAGPRAAARASLRPQFRPALGFVRGEPPGRRHLASRVGRCRIWSQRRRVCSSFVPV